MHPHTTTQTHGNMDYGGYYVLPNWYHGHYPAQFVSNTVPAAGYQHFGNGGIVSGDHYHGSGSTVSAGRAFGNVGPASGGPSFRYNGGTVSGGRPTGNTNPT